MIVDLHDLEWFLAIVDAGTFGRAADALRVSQPSLSRRVAAMERKLGVALFSRERRQIELTPAGRALAREARGLLADAQAMVDLARCAARGVSADTCASGIGARIGTASCRKQSACWPTAGTTLL